MWTKGQAGLGKRQLTRSLCALAVILFYLQAIDDPGMSLLDQSVIKKGKKWCATSRAEPGVMVQAPGRTDPFSSPWPLFPVRRQVRWPRNILLSPEEG